MQYKLTSAQRSQPAGDPGGADAGRVDRDGGDPGHPCFGRRSAGPLSAKREKERELRYDLWQMRDAIDHYKDAADRHAFQTKVDSDELSA